jgi:hypothetical protein
MLCRRLKDGNAISLHEIRFFINTSRQYYHFFCIAVNRFQMINSGCAPTVMGLIKADFSGPKHSGLILLAKSAQSIFDPGGYIVTGAVGSSSSGIKAMTLYLVSASGETCLNSHLTSSSPAPSSRMRGQTYICAPFVHASASI